MAITIKKIVKIGSQFPLGYGLAYYNVRETTDDEQTGVCYPIPLNWLIAFLRGVYFRLQWHPFFFKVDPIKMAYDKGKQEGRKELYTETQKRRDTNV